MENKVNKYLIYGLGFAIFAVFAVLAFLIFGGKTASNLQQKKSDSTISGKLDINGVIPQGATITLTAREIGTEDGPQTFVSDVVLQDGDSWEFGDAKAGRSYEIQAIVMKGKTKISESSPISITAPADDESLRINVEDVAANPAQNAVISGNIVVNGYIPPGATITVLGRKLGEQEFTTIAASLPGQPRQFMSYTTATQGATYEVVGALTQADGKTNIGTSATLIISAPALNETLLINSTAQPAATPTSAPAPTTSAIQPTSAPTPTPQPVVISGSINFNGDAPANSRIVIFQNTASSTNNQVAVDNITPIDGATWSWKKPTNGTNYNLTAILKQRQSDGTDKDISTSPTISVTAPATNVQFTVNSGMSLAAPSGAIKVTCQTYNSSQNNWSAQLSFQSVTAAQSYWFQIGTTNGGIENTNSTQNTNNQSSQYYNTTFNNNTTYYARYAYANVGNLQAGNTQYSASQQPNSSVTTKIGYQVRDLVKYRP